MKAQSIRTRPSASKDVRLVREVLGGEIYEYIPLGEYVVLAPGVCGGRPTFKYTRLEVNTILSLLASGETIDEIVRVYSHSHLTKEAVQEAIRLAGQAFVKSGETLHPLAA
ncbi:MAG: DUF433 domain-containing protein [Chloroflexi bacterium]|nr:DUF433 domain-containing protein [Chloroflexota bacterium]